MGLRAPDAGVALGTVLRAGEPAADFKVGVQGSEGERPAALPAPVNSDAA